MGVGISLLTKDCSEAARHILYMNHILHRIKSFVNLVDKDQNVVSYLVYIQTLSLFIQLHVNLVHGRYSFLG